MDIIDTRIYFTRVVYGCFLSYFIILSEKFVFIAFCLTLSLQLLCDSSTNSPFQLHEQLECGQRRRDGAGGRVRRTVVRPQNRGRKLTPRKLGRAV